MSASRAALDNFFASATLFGTPLFYAAAAFFLWAAGSHLLTAFIAAWAAVEIACVTIKLAYPKSRPVSGKEGSFLDRLSARSFPSNHSARAAMLAAIIFMSSREPFVVAGVVTLVALVALSRVYFKKHDIFDVAGGMIIGGAAGFAAAAFI